MNTIGTQHFPSVIAVYQIFIIFFNTFVRLLNTTPCRSIITSHRQANHRAIGQVDGTLHQPLTESTATNHYSSVPVLNSSGHDFTGRSRKLIHQHNQTSIPEISGTLGKELATRVPASFGINNQLLFFQKFICQIDGSIQITSTVTLQIKHQIFHA